MPSAEARVAFVVDGVVRQALLDSGARAAHMIDANPKQAALVRKWCAVEFSGDVADDTLLLSSANKTELMLSTARPRADVYPLGDLYATDVAGFAGGFELSDEVGAMVTRFGGIVALDGALRAFLEERRGTAQAELEQWLARARFVRQQIGVVPKLGARTLGIDLFI
jgi:hypothetical protein